MYPTCTRVHLRILRSSRPSPPSSNGSSRSSIVASGDLTHRGRREQHERAARFLRSLGPPVLTVPGNHDMPYTFPARFTQTFVEFERQWETTEQTHSSPLAPRRRPQLGAAVPAPERRPPRGPAAPRQGAARGGARGRVPRRRPPPPHGGCAVARVAQAAGRAPEPRVARARRLGRRPHPRRAHPPGGGERAPRVRGRERRRARGGDLDRARPRPAAAEPARRGARPARLRGRRARRSPCTRTSGGATTGASPRNGCSRAGSAPSPSSRARPSPRCPSPAGVPADERDEDHGDDDADDEREPTARDGGRDDHRDDADRDGQEPAHRIAPGMNEPAERADECSNEDEPYPVHVPVLSRVFRR